MVQVIELEAEGVVDDNSKIVLADQVRTHLGRDQAVLLMPWSLESGFQYKWTPFSLATMSGSVSKEGPALETTACWQCTVPLFLESYH
jgi:hypothetical protein